jgi:SnoaL-like domain
MQTDIEQLESRQAIADLMTGWMHRDLAEWDQLLALFHPDATIAFTWFEGKFADFVDASKRMRQSNFKSKHLIGSPVITFNGDRAISETNAVIIGDNVTLDLGFVAHNRFYDLVEKRHGIWKILRRQSIYDCAYFTFTWKAVEIDRSEFQKYPREYASLAYLIDKSGFPVQRVFATKGSDLERKMKQDAQLWMKK